jgi:hypothetical protein
MFCSKQVMIGASKNIWGFDPRTIPNCALWLDPADTSTVTLNGANVSQLNDKSGLGYNMSQTTAGNQPTYSTALNGNRMLTFTQASSTRLSNVSFPAFIGAGAASYFLVEYNMTGTGNPGPFGYSAGPNSGIIYQYNPGSVGGGTVFISGFQPFRDATTFDVAFYSAVPRISYLTIPNTGSGMVGFINGVSRSVGTQTAGTYSGTFSVGSGTNGFISGNICELIVFNRSLTNSERQQIEGYLAQKWRVIPPTSGFIPTSITGCQLWLDGTDTSTMTFSGANITQWRDKSGNARNTTSVVGTPTLTSLNSVPAISFNGSSDFTGSIPGSGTALTVCIVGSRTAGAATNGGVVCFGRTGQPDWNDVGSLFIGNGDTSLRVMLGTRTANTQFAYIGAQAFMYILIFDGTNVNTFLNGGAIASPIANTGTFAFTEYKIANRAGNTGNIRHTGTIGEVVVFNSALTVTQRQQMEGYLGNKWGLKTPLPVTQPYYPFRPHLTTFRPFDVPGCELWFDGGDYRTMFQNTAGTTPVTAAGQSVACWKDKIRNISVTDTGISGRASVAPTAVSGGGLLFNNVSASPTSTTQSLGAYLTGATNQTAFLFRMPTKTMTIVTVSLPLSNNGYRRICLLGSDPLSGGPPNFILGPQMGASEGGTGASDLNSAMTAWGQNFSTSSGYNSNAVLRIDTMIMSNTGLWFTNGTSNTITINPTYTTANSNYPVNFIYFAGYSSTIDGGRSFNGTIYETILYSRALAANERQQVEGYLAHKWGLSTSLPAVHLYRTIPAAAVVPPVVNALTITGGQDAFVVKYDSSGTPLWARKMGGTGGEWANSVSTDLSGNIVVFGYYESSLLNIFAADGTTASFTLANVNSDASTDCFVVKYNPTGTPLWARRIGGNSGDDAQSVTTDSSENIVVVGTYFSNPLNIFAVNGSTVSFSLTRFGFEDVFVVKYDSSGTPLWARILSGTGNDRAYSVSTDSSGNVIVTGRYSSNPLNIYAANGTTVSFTLSNSGTNDIFVVKYDSSGTPLWARRMGGTGNDDARTVSTDSSGNIIVTGSYPSPLNIFAADGTTVSFTLSNAGSNDAFLVKYDSSGTLLWARRIAGTGNDIANSVSTDSSQNIVVTGNYGSTSLSFYT